MVATISFDAGNGSGTMLGDAVESGGTFVLPECTFTPPSGKRFSRWAQTDGEDETHYYYAGDNFTVGDDDVTFVAQWAAASDGSPSAIITDSNDENGAGVLVLFNSFGDDTSSNIDATDIYGKQYSGVAYIDINEEDSVPWSSDITSVTAVKPHAFENACFLWNSE